MSFELAPFANKLTTGLGDVLILVSISFIVMVIVLLIFFKVYNVLHLCIT